MAILTVADTIFLTKMQKRKITETILSMITRKHNLSNFAFGGDMLKNL